MSLQETYFSHLQRLLSIEKTADQEQYNQAMLSSSFKEKTQKGLCWEPLVIKESGYGLGDYPFVVVERVKQKDMPHQFAAGKQAVLYLAGGDANEKSKGTIHFVSGNTLKIILSANDLPEWLSTGRIGIQLSFDDKSYEEMENTLAALVKTKDARIETLLELILAKQPQKKLSPANFQPAPLLNASQNEAVKSILGNQDICIVHGPPGTGKTTTLVEAIKRLCHVEKRVLVCTPSNAAADLLTEKLAQQGLNVMRIGHISRVDEAVLQHTVDQKLAQSDVYKQIKQIRKQADEYRRMASKYHRNFGKDERTQRNLLLKEAKNSVKDAVDLENATIDVMLSKAQVVTCTLVGANHKYLDKLAFDTVVIDEAAQALEPATWIPLLKASKAVLAGDPFQLPPTVKSDEARKAGFETTLMETALPNLRNVNLLDTQYRMNGQIMGYSNEYFYAGKLLADASVQDHTLLAGNGPSAPLELIDTAGCGFDEKIQEETRSYYNPEEWNILLRHLQQLTENNTGFQNIGIISPYKEQVQYMQKNLAAELAGRYNISINTIDSFQGQERDVVYISLVRCNSKSEIGFLRDYRRMNVAMTRARKKLIVIGDSATFGHDAFYGGFMKYCETQNAYHSAWEWMG